MKQTKTLIVPTQWKDVSLQSYIRLQEELKNHIGDEIAQTHCTLYHLCGLEPDSIKDISVQSYARLKAKLSLFETPETLPLQNFIHIGGVEYGFEPNLSQMSYGAYADISQWDTIQIDNNWAKIMSILYRPVVKKSGDLWEIEGYKGGGDWKPFLELSMDVHWGVWFFFVHLQMDLLKDTLKSLTEMETNPNIKSILERSGKVIQQSWNWPEEISKG